VQNKAQDDDLVMGLVEETLARPIEQRKEYLRRACAGDAELFGQVWSYVESQERMQGFLLEPVCIDQEPEHPFAPGELLDGRFRILREVAQGGMGIVYEAMDERLDRRIAIKCAKAGFRKRLPPEVRNASEISHPNVCKIFEIHTASTPEGDTDFLTMEFLDGETLAERLHRGLLPREEARSIARQLAEGLAAAHGKQVIHGDLKSNNVILTKGPDGMPLAVITDFGLAQRPRTALNTIQSGIAGGTPDYMAPELWRGEKASSASDVYALGVILYELAAGRRPFASEVPPDERLKPHSLPSAWDRTVARCLDPDPALRFRDGAGVAKALSPSSLRRWLLAGAAAAVLMVVTGVVTYQRGAAPKESWRLAMLPIESTAETRDIAHSLSREVADRMTLVKGGDAARLKVVSFDSMDRQHVDTPEKAASVVGATHVLHAALEKTDNGNLVVRAALTDTRTGINGKTWTAAYSPDELKYIPTALVGVVTWQLGLPPVGVATVNAAAIKDYREGLQNLRYNSTVDAALPLLERAVTEDPDSPLTFAALAAAQQWKWFLTKDRSRLELAKETERQAQLRNPDLAEVHRVAGILSLREGLYDLATVECIRAIVLFPNDGEAHRVLGQAYDGTDRVEEALTEYRKAVELDPRDYRNHQQLGNFRYRHADYKDALPHLLDAVKLAPYESGPHFALASDYINLERLPDAESELRLAIRLRETPEELHNLGVVLFEQKRYAEAAASILRALSLAPEQLIWRMNLGTVYRLMNRTAESEKAFRRALELAGRELARDPRDGRTRSYLAFVCARLGDATRAETEIEQAQALDPKDPSVRFMAVATYEALGRRTDALKLLGTFSYRELADVNRWPDMADLSHDSRFLQLRHSRQRK